MSTTIREAITASERYLRLNARSTEPRHLPYVFVGIPCEHADHGEHALALSRDEFTELVKRELRLVEVEAGSFELSEDDLELLKS